MAVIPFGGAGLGFGFDGSGFGFGPQVTVGAAWVPDRVLGAFGGTTAPVQGHIYESPNRHQRQGLSRKGRKLYGNGGSHQAQLSPKSSIDFSDLFNQ